MYKTEAGELHVLLVHPGGPFWAKKDAGAWTIPKGEFTEAEEPLTAARREFFEETGHRVTGECLALTPLKQKSGKRVHAWATEGELDVTKLVSNTFEMEWPPGSGQLKQFPEIDKGRWFTVAEALEKILPSQQGFVTELEALLKA